VKAAAPVYQLKIELVDVQPEVWRRVLVPGSIRLSVLHGVVLRSMGWQGGHLHEFTIAGEQYGTPEPEFGDDRDIKNGDRITLADAVGPLKSFTYVYDFGDNWEHLLKVEKILPPDPELKYPVCLAGENACPPEDCGGPYGYEEFLEIINDPNNEEHDAMVEWCGGSFDRTTFDLTEVNETLAEFIL
jgi:hypothetical protein